MTDIRKIVTIREVIVSELGRAAARPIVRAVGIAVIHNPFAGAGWRICTHCSRPAPLLASG